MKDDRYIGKMIPCKGGPLNGKEIMYCGEFMETPVPVKLSPFYEELPKTIPEPCEYRFSSGTYRYTWNSPDYHNFLTGKN